MSARRVVAAVILAGSLVAGSLVAGSLGAGSPSADDTPPSGELATAIFAGGCFWCMEQPFDVLDGVVSTTSGYIGGHVTEPTYQQVSAGRTGHTEAVRIVYDPAKIGYQALLEVFWRNVDPLDAGGQFCDRGSQYRTGIFATTDEQLRLAETSKAALEASGRLPGPVVTEIVTAPTFYAAEDYHQDYYLTSSARYKVYRFACGRDRRLDQLWGSDRAG